MNPQSMAAVGTGLAAVGMGLSALAAGVGIGLSGHATLTGMARQPEERRRLIVFFFVFSALVEGRALFALVVCLMLAMK